MRQVIAFGITAIAFLLAFMALRADTPRVGSLQLVTPSGALVQVTLGPGFELLPGIPPVLQVSGGIAGPVGPQGPPGANGAQGLQGPLGPPGPVTAFFPGSLLWVRFDSVGLGQVDPSVVGPRVAVPASAATFGVVGSWASDQDYYYLCVRPNQWRRVNLGVW